MGLPGSRAGLLGEVVKYSAACSGGRLKERASSRNYKVSSRRIMWLHPCALYDKQTDR